MKKIVQFFSVSAMVLFVSVSVDAQGMGGDMWMMEGRSNSSQRDRNFIEMMIPHHQDAIDMANLALAKSKKPEVLKLSQDIIKAQTAEIVMMRKWYKTWYGTDVPAMRKMMGMRNKEMQGMGQVNIDDLKKAADFDREFLEMMIQHHRMAVMMSGMIVDSTHPEMRKLSRDISVSQSAEIEMMIVWLTGWYKPDEKK